MLPDPSASRPGTRAGLGPRDAGAFTRGIGPILQLEYALQVAMEQQRSEARGPRAPDMIRILDRQQTHLSAGVAALDRHCDVLPHAERFHRLEWRHARSEATAPAPSSSPAKDGLSGLAALHLELAGSIRQVMDQQACNGRDPALETVAREHEEMAWVLSALSHEGEYSQEGVVGPPAVPTSGEARWENEGGSLDDLPTAPSDPPASPNRRPRSES